MSLPRGVDERGELARSFARLAVALSDDALGVDSVMVIAGGRVVGERWWRGCSPSLPHEMYSVTKTFTSLAVGVAVSEGRLSIEEPLRAFFGAEGNGIDRRITLRHLLTMSSGRESNDLDLSFTTPDSAIVHYASLPQLDEPGTTFAYSSLSSHIASLALGRRTGVTLYDYLDRRVLRPLGIVSPAWQTDLEGNQLGGTGLFLTTEELARLGLVLLGGGVYDGRVIVSPSWVEEASRAHLDTALPDESRPEWKQGYGFQLWRGLHSTYRADGMLGQYAIVAPKKDMVVAVTARSQRTHIILDRVAEHLFR